MSLLDGVTTRCIAIAARRWPTDIRADQVAEWGAELHVMATDPGTGRLIRALRRLRFALSLAASPPVEDENGVPRGWREFLPAWGRMLWPALVLVGAGIATNLLTSFIGVSGRLLGDLFLGSNLDYADAPRAIWTKVAIGFAVCAVAAFLVGWFGTLVGRRLPLLTAPRTAWRRALAAVGAVALVGLGFALSAFWSGVGVFYDWFGLGMWAVVAAAVAIGVVFIARGGMRWVARVLGVAGGLILLDLVAVEIGLRRATAPDSFVTADLIDLSMAPLWFPMSLGSHEFFLFNTPEPTTVSTTGDIAWTLSGSMTAYLLALVFLIGYTVRSARAAVRVPAAAPAVVVEPRVVPRRPRIAALACVAVALGTWAWTVSYTASRIEPRDDHPELFVRGFELRLAAILLAMLALAYALNGRGRPLVPTVVGGVTLLIADIAVSAVDIPDPTAFVLAGVFGAGLAWGVWSLARSFTVTATPNGRRGQAVIALLAVYAAPLVFLQMTSGDASEFADPPADLRVITAVIAAATIALGMTAAVTARKRPPSKGRALAMVTVPAVLFAAIGLAGDGERVPFLAGAGLLALPMFLIAATVIRWDRVRRPALRIAILALVFAPAMALQGVIVLLGVNIGGWTITEPLMNAAGTGISHDGVPMFIGAMIIGLPAAIIVSRDRTARPKTLTARVGGLTTV
ncbi:hypothetical protein [Phytomonospora endophytica]|uniref:Uncharacterized protein n=1 Tax=Phytomonospora endophytica TaxID=714109 RepID=A0A841FGC1_9ACTN|nr:hypothetical protein [Phytomonospora endophytica]MBB6034914.1 hypothetical protein [Phytomonospora endophytica]GIG70618.1 hypothetical protein Pen01_69130 [Phytomonospora endophytica]